MAKEKMFTVDKFLGLNESGDSHTELKMGEASVMENFTVTDAGNLAVRPGIQRVPGWSTGGARIIAAWSGYVRKDEYLIVVEVSGGGANRIGLFTRGEDGAFSLVEEALDKLGFTDSSAVVKIFPFGEFVYIMGPNGVISVRVLEEDTRFVAEEPYIPTVLTGGDPAGGGTSLEPINLLTSLRKAVYSGDGEAKTFVLPSEATAVIAGYDADIVHMAFTFDAESHSVTFTNGPTEGVNNFTILYDTDAEAAAASYAAVAAMPYVEAYNGTTDTRLFFYGDGTNRCYYTGLTDAGVPSALYVPAMNEITVDFSGSPITSMIRHYSKLLVFKPDGAYAITYQPTTLDDGTVIPGFLLRSTQKGLGNDAPGQVQLVNNYPRTLCGDALSGTNLYEWRIPTSYLVDERYAKNISAAVRKSLRAADPSKIVACDDRQNSTYYLFLNDEAGTVLVHRYNLDAWTIYRSPHCTGVKFALVNSGTMMFLTLTDIFYFDPAARYDVPVEPGGEHLAIPALWESGYMSFGADYLRKFSSRIWVSMLPEQSAKVTVTASTDRRDTYVEKAICNGIFDYGAIDYAFWSYVLSPAPRIKRIRLKVKKFVYYKLIFRVDDPGARATILGYDQQVRYSGFAK